MKTGSFSQVLLIWSLKEDTYFILFLLFTKLSDDKVKLTDFDTSKAVADITKGIIPRDLKLENILVCKIKNRWRLEAHIE